MLSVRGQKQLPLIQFVPLGASGAEFKSGLSLPRSQVGEPVHAPIHSSGVTHWLFFFFFHAGLLSLCTFGRRAESLKKVVK